MKKETRAISTLLAILLILLSAIIGALVAYAWTMAPFYLEPENIVDLVVTDANFPVDNAKYFDVEIMNPSHSISGTNITTIYVTAEGADRETVTSSQPKLPIFLDRGTTQRINCSLEWGGLAGRTVTVHVLTMNNTEAARAVRTQFAGVDVTANFDPSRSIEYFNVSVTNRNSPINLTLTNVQLDLYPIAQNETSITLPALLPMNKTVEFDCFVNWEGHITPSVIVETREGYKAEVRSDANGTASLQVTRVAFSDTNSSEVSVTLFNSPTSATSVNITEITFSHGNIKDTISESLSNPALPKQIGKNETAIFVCAWSWASYRNISVAVNASTAQGFISSTLTTRTPLEVAGRVDGVLFDLNDTGTFLVNVTNMPYSLQSFNVTGIDLNQDGTNITSLSLAPGDQATIPCTFDWSSFVGQNVAIRVNITYDSNSSLLYYNLRLPYLKITNVTFFEFSPTTPYVNVTIHNFDKLKVGEITQVSIKIENTTTPITGSTGYRLGPGSDIAILCSWDWKPYSGKDATIVVETADGYQVSATFRLE